MIRRLLLPSALTVVLIAGCSSSTSEDEPTAGETTAAGAAETEAADPEAAACDDFYTGTGTPLAERAEAARQALSAGEVTDVTAYSEINALEQRITELGDGAPDSLAALLTDVNEPFTETVFSYNEGAGEEGELPDFTTIDVEASAAAQQELDTLCEPAAG